ncbi:MAG: C39 family peptidase [Lachnospiraceae bacterium]|nr:C39 family peptidase [Lachnospiraceae bacterium]
MDSRNAKRRRSRRKRRKQLMRRGCVVMLLLLCVLMVGRAKVKQERELRVNAFGSGRVEQELLKKYKHKKGIQTIVKHLDEYPEDVIELLRKNEETYDFVRNYLKDHKNIKSKQLKKRKNNEIPMLQQWDQAWGYDSYGNNIIAINGCGPTCLSMVAIGLLNDEDLTPNYIAGFSEENSFYQEGVGTKWDLMTQGASMLGLKSTKLSLDEAKIKEELEQKHPIIATVRAGDFTTKGHFIVIVKSVEKDKVIVYDPNSIANSKKKWKLSKVLEQVKNLWAFEKAN